MTLEATSPRSGIDLSYLDPGARPQDEWTTYRLTGQALVDFAAG